MHDYISISPPTGMAIKSQSQSQGRLSDINFIGKHAKNKSQPPLQLHTILPLSASVPNGYNKPKVIPPEFALDNDINTVNDIQT